MSYGYNPYAQPGGAPPPGAFPPQQQQQQSPAYQWFAMVDRDRSGKINAEELQAALINGRGEKFSSHACKLMISMFDNDASGSIDVYEFEKLYNYINQWLQVFKTYDQDSSGHIEEGELTQAFTQMGFRFTPEFINFLVKKSDPNTHKEVSVDQFIVLCVQIQRFTEAFRQRDTQQNGTITIGFEDFLSVAIGCSY
ncbi:CG17765 [Drosophila busckii]|uniref:CG17765 n=1 Tax=Drosophila busckii TaxID=30019 RepID=A0A0M3QUG3_DROBS|nr:peflin [Drosophila busckii]ALC40613.1 CG17765 [Drosophila busckii]